MSDRPNEQPYMRPDPEHRWIGGRTEPVTIQARTRFLYADENPRGKFPPGRTRHAFSRGADLVSADIPIYRDRPSLRDAISVAVAEFGDDADIEIVIRRRGPSMVGFDQDTAPSGVYETAPGVYRALYRFPSGAHSLGVGHSTREAAQGDLAEWIEQSRQLWERYISAARNGDRIRGLMCVRVDGNHYVPQWLGRKPDIPGELKGFSGSLHRWRMIDTGEEFESDSLFHQGLIPEELRHELPDNAEFISSASDPRGPLT